MSNPVSGRISVNLQSSMKTRQNFLKFNDTEKPQPDSLALALQARAARPKLP